MELYYKNKNDVISFVSKDTEKSLDGFFKKSLKKHNSNIYEYLSNIGYIIEKCRVCKEEYPPIKVNYVVNNSFVDIEGFEYIKKIYCYCKNENCPGKKMNPNSFIFVSLVNNISLEEAKKVLKSSNKSPFYKENWGNEEEYYKSQSRSIEYYIEKYGDLGREKFEEHMKKISFSNTIDGYKDRYGESIGIEKYKKVCDQKDSTSYNFFLVKNNYDEKAAEIDFKNRVEKVKITVENLIKKYGSDKGLDAFCKWKQRISESVKKVDKSNRLYGKPMFLSKYGEEEGTDRYFKWVQKAVSPFARASKESMKVFGPIISYLISLKEIEFDDIYVGHGDKTEYFLRSGESIYFYDFTIRSKRIIIEYNGIFWHPKNLTTNFTLPHKRFDVSEAFNKQNKKISLARDRGFNVLEIWSDEENKIEKCLEFIKKNL